MSPWLSTLKAAWLKTSKWQLLRRLKCTLGIGSVGGVCILLVYLFWYTPFPVYVLDRLNLRPFFLPNILHKDRCNDFNYTFIIENSNFCGDPNEELFLLIIVTTYHPNVDARQMIRKTWGSIKKHNEKTVKTLFLFGTHADKNFNNQVQYEMEHYGDVVQGNFKDNYRSLTNKTTMGLQWIRKNCQQARFVLKTDDDGFNVPQRYVEYLVHEKNDKFIGGYCFTVMPDRRDGSKFYIPHAMYPDRYYPTYCSGPGYVLSQSAVREIVNIAPYVTFVHMEDVFVSGMCRVAANIQYVQIPGTVVDQTVMTKCNLATWVKNSHNIWPAFVPELWKRVLDSHKERDCVGRNTVIFIIFLIFAACWCRLLWNLSKKR